MSIQFENTPFLTQEVCVFETIDGTNFGIQYDEAYFGRRQRVEGDIYQRVHLKGVVPDADAIQSIKKAIRKLIGIDPQSLPQMIVCGELMCNPGRFQYTVDFSRKNDLLSVSHFRNT